MPSPTGIWTKEEALENHDFSYELARYVGDILPKEDTVIDFGCGRGAYLRYLHDRGFESLLGIEGEVYPFNYFGNIQAQDLVNPFTRDPIGNSLFLEVGEHIPEEYQDVVLDNVCNNTSGKLIMSWAIPNQEGFSHINCKSNIWVLGQLEKRGFKPNWEQTLEGRDRIENRFQYFKNTLIIFDKI